MPKKTSYVMASPSGSVQDQLNVGDDEIPVAPFDGLGLDGAVGGLFVALNVVKLHTDPVVVALLLSLATIFQ